MTKTEVRNRVFDALSPKRVKGLVEIRKDKDFPHSIELIFDSGEKFTLIVMHLS